MVDLKDELLFTFGGLNNTPKELLFDWFDMKYKSLLKSIESAQDMYKQAFEGQEEKISSLINERENYKGLYYQTKEELDRLKDTSSCLITIDNLIKELNTAKQTIDNLKIELYDMTKMRDNWKSDHDYQYECFCAERERRQELEKIVDTSHRIKNLNGKLTLIDKGYYKLLVLSDDKVEMTILGNVEYYCTLKDLVLKEFDTYYYVWKSSFPFLKVNKITREVTKL